MNNIQELVSKLMLLSNPATHDTADALSKMKTANDVANILNHRAMCVNMQSLILCNILPCASVEEKERMLLQCQNEINACDKVLRNTMQKAIFDFFMSQITKATGVYR